MKIAELNPFSDHELQSKISSLETEIKVCGEKVSACESKLAKQKNFGIIQNQKNQKLKKMLNDTRKNNHILKNQLLQNQCDDSKDIIHQNEINELKVSMDSLKKQNEDLELKLKILEEERDAEKRKSLQCESEKKICQEEIVSNREIISKLQSGSAEHIITKQELHDCEEELEDEIQKNQNLQTTASTNRRRAQECQDKLQDEIEAKEILSRKSESFRSLWSEWSSCSNNCGGVRTRMDKCSFNNKETEPCKENCSKSGKSDNLVCGFLVFGSLFHFSVGYGQRKNSVGSSDSEPILLDSQGMYKTILSRVLNLNRYNHVSHIGDISIWYFTFFI